MRGGGVMVDNESMDALKEAGSLYLARVEAAAMQVLTEAVLDRAWQDADEAISIMERLSIV